jgi:predicted acyl esterase
MGWLRASHRELDPGRSLPHRPVHPHRRAVPLTPGEPTPLDIEIRPTSIVLHAGDRLVLRIRANDDDMAVLAHDDPHDRDRNRLSGTNPVHTRGGYDSLLARSRHPPPLQR